MVGEAGRRIDLGAACVKQRPRQSRLTLVGRVVRDAVAERPIVGRYFHEVDEHILLAKLHSLMEAVRKFAGEEPEKAVVEPEARAVLTAFDESVTHFEVVHRPEGTAK